LLKKLCRFIYHDIYIPWDVGMSGLPMSRRVSSRGHSHRLATGHVAGPRLWNNLPTEERHYVQTLQTIT